MSIYLFGDSEINKADGLISMKVDKRTTTLCLVPVIFIFILVGTMSVVPAITEKAHARVDGRAFSFDGSFHGVSRGCFHNDGRFVSGPTNFGKEIVWSTIGTRTPFGGGDERCVVSAHVGTQPVPGCNFGDEPRVGYCISFFFNNPTKGENTCRVSSHPPGLGTCTITQGVTAVALFKTPPSPLLDDDDPDIGDLQDQLQDAYIFKDKG